MSKKIIFLRHAKTPGNISSPEKETMFFGRNTDLGILQPELEEVVKLKEQVEDCKVVFCSPTKRCKETIELIRNQDSKVILDKNLHEIDYGYLDGAYFNEAKEKYPFLFEEWNLGKDPRFPNGENTEDIFNRYKEFIKTLRDSPKENILVCTHNVFLRVLFGNYFKMPMKDWFKIYVPHFEPIEFELNNEAELVYKGNDEQKNKILKEFNKIHKYFIALTPEQDNYNKIVKAKEYVFHKFGNQKYLKDEPHSTLYLSLTQDLNKVKEILEKIAENSFKIKTFIQEEFQEFPNDALAGGGTSLGIKFNQKANQEIQSLQKEIVDKLNYLRENKIHRRFKNAGLPQNMRESLENYGYPFVNGSNKMPILIPHINFCTFKDEKNAEEFKKENPVKNFAGPMVFDKLSLYKLNDDDSIELIRNFELQ